MTSDRWRQINEAFLVAARLAPAERPAHLSRLGGSDPGLRREVERLLAADERADSDAFLADSPLDRLRADAAQRPAAGSSEPAATNTSNLAPHAKPSEFAVADAPRAIRIPDFDLVRRLDGGTFGDVWLAASRSGVYRAVKILPRSLLTEVEIDGLRKYETFAARHPNLIDIRHIGETPDCVYYVMELADGYAITPTFDPADYLPRTLKSDLRRHGPLDPQQAVATTRQILAGLGHLHAAGLLHRDIKPANIVFVAGAPKLADIGLLALDDTHRRSGMTPDYAPPGGVIDRAGDCYCVGRVLAELLCGTLPPIGQCLPADLPEARAAAAAPFLKILSQACAADPAARFQSAADFDRALLAAAETPTPDPAVRPQPNRTPADLQRATRRLMHGRNAALAGILLTFTVTALLYPAPPPRGTLKMSVVPQGRSADAELPVETEFPLTPHDQVRFRITLDRPGYPVLVLIAPDGSPTIAYPTSVTSQPRSIALDVPPAGAYWPLPEGSGCLLAVLLVAEKPITDLDAIRARFADLPAPDLPAEYMVYAIEDRWEPLRTSKLDRPRGGFDPQYTQRVREGAILTIRRRFAPDFPFVAVLAVPQIPQ